VLKKSSDLVFTCREIESDVDKAEDDEGEGHEDGGRNTEHEPAIVALPDALQQTKKAVLNGILNFYFNFISKSDKISKGTRTRVLEICCFQEFCCYLQQKCVN
jgi:hypothetical protein